jgi:ABC-type transport system involved in cytochrome c biogenesis permease subunit
MFPISRNGGDRLALSVTHLTFFWLSLAAYGVEAGFRVAGVAPSRMPSTPLFAGVLFHAAFLGLRWGISGHAPMAGLFESLTVFSFCCAVAGIVLCGPGETDAAWVPLSVLVLLPQAAAAFLDKRLTPSSPVLDTPWFASHVGLSFIGYGFFTAGTALGAVYLRRGGEEVYRAAGRSVLYGFSAFSAGMVCGGIWAYYAWGSYWVWTPKEIWSVIVWLYFAALMHLKFIVGRPPSPWWTRRLEMGATAAGYGVVLLTFLGVSLLLRSSHSFG